MKPSNPLRRLLWAYLLMMVGLSVLAVVESFASGDAPQTMNASFAWLFFLGGLAWLLVAYFSGGFVATYRGPILNPRLSLIYSVRSKGALVLPSDAPEVMTDLKDKLNSQTGPMVLGALSFLGFLALAITFNYVPWLGYLTLAGALLVLGAALWRGRPGRGGPSRRGEAPSQPNRPRKP